MAKSSNMSNFLDKSAILYLVILVTCNYHGCDGLRRVVNVVNMNVHNYKVNGKQLNVKTEPWSSSYSPMTGSPYANAYDGYATTTTSTWTTMAPPNCAEDGAVMSSKQSIMALVYTAADTYSSLGGTATVANDEMGTYEMPEITDDDVASVESLILGCEAPQVEDMEAICTCVSCMNSEARANLMTTFNACPGEMSGGPLTDVSGAPPASSECVEVTPPGPPGVNFGRLPRRSAAPGTAKRFHQRVAQSPVSAPATIDDVISQCDCCALLKSYVYQDGDTCSSVYQGSVTASHCCNLPNVQFSSDVTNKCMDLGCSTGFFKEAVAPANTSAMQLADQHGTDVDKALVNKAGAC